MASAGPAVTLREPVPPLPNRSHRGNPGGDSGGRGGRTDPGPGDAGGRQPGRLLGTDVVVAHLRKSYKAGPFRIDPDCGKVKWVARSIVSPLTAPASCDSVVALLHVFS
jgi:hypothetical protein